MRAVAIALFLLAGCTGRPTFSDISPRASDNFTSVGFSPTGTGYRVRFADPSSCTFISSGWHVGNFPILRRTGCPTAMRIRTRNHLTLERTGGTGVIWVRSIPLEPFLERTSLPVLADSYVRSVAERGYFDRNTVGDTVPYADTRALAQIRDRRAITLDGEPAVAVMADLATVRQHENDPSRATRALIVFVQPSATHPHQDGYRERGAPILLVAGYVDATASFESGVADFVTFLRAIELDDRVAR